MKFLRATLTLWKAFYGKGRCLDSVVEIHRDENVMLRRHVGSGEPPKFLTREFG